MKKIILLLLSLFALLNGILFWNTHFFISKQKNAPSIQPITVNEQAAENLSKAIQIQTISYDIGKQAPLSVFKEYIDFLAKTYPLCDSLLNKKVINQKSILYTWKGSDTTLQPIVLIAHHDVVPIENEANWEQPPFSGKITDGYIWGRGALDDKNSMLGILEAVESLLKEKFQPQRTVYLAFGHDEEISGREGSKQIANILYEQEICPAYVLDEGMVVTQGMMPGIFDPIALVGLTEKGYITLEISVLSKGGHSSMPPSETAIGILSQSIVKLENNPFPQHLEGAVGHLLDAIGPEMPFQLKTVMANRWLFGSLLKTQFAQGNSTNALTRTTIAPTMLEGSVKENVLPSMAKATVNFRILPGDTPEDVEKYVKKIINDKRVQIQSVGAIYPPPPVSSPNAPAYHAIAKTIRQLFPNSIIAPALSVAITDSRHYAQIADNVYRFMPVLLKKEDIARIHGANERISVEAYEKSIQFYYQLIKNSQNWE